MFGNKVKLMINGKSALKFWVWWTIANGIGELLGLGAVFVTGYFAAGSMGAPKAAPELAALALLVIVLAAFEGSVVGLAQWLVLRRPFPAMPPLAWVGATVIGAVIAWVLGMLPSTLGAFDGAAQTPPEEPSLLVILALTAVMGAVLGVILAAAQWRVLRHYIRRAALWLVANAAAWLVAMPLIFLLVGSTIAEHHTPGSLVLLVLGIGGAGLVAGGIHGIFLIFLLR